MTKDLVFYTNPQSRGRIARWMLEEVGADYQTEVLEYGAPMKTEAYLALNPMGKVPTIQHGDQVVTETAAICAYLADAFPEAELAPHPEERAPYYRWLFFAAGPLEAAITNRSMGVEVPEERQGNVGYGSFSRVVETLADAVDAHDYIAGERFTAADVYVGSQVGWGLQFETLEPRPEFRAYWERLSGREARERAEQLDNALIAEDGGE